MVRWECSLPCEAVSPNDGFGVLLRASRTLSDDRASTMDALLDFLRVRSSSNSLEGTRITESLSSSLSPKSSCSTSWGEVAGAPSCCPDISTEGICVTESGTIVGVLWADIFSSSGDAASVCTRGKRAPLFLPSSAKWVSSSDMEDGLVEGAADEPCVCADVGEDAECTSSDSVRAVDRAASAFSCGSVSFASGTCGL